MFCISCGSKNDDDALFCTACGAKMQSTLNPVPEELPPQAPVLIEEPPIQLPDEIVPEKSPVPDAEFAPKVKLRKNTDDQQQQQQQPLNSNDETVYVGNQIPVDEEPPEARDMTETEKEMEMFFGSTEPIQHISPEPLQENILKKSGNMNPQHNTTPLPELVLKKKTEPDDNQLPKNNLVLTPPKKQDNQNSRTIPQTPPHEPENPCNDNTDTRAISREEIEREMHNLYGNNPPPPPQPEPYPEYYNNYPADPPVPPDVPAPPPPPPIRQFRPKVSGLKRFGAGVVTFVTIIFFTVLSLMFCMKLGLSGSVLSKQVRNISTEKFLDAQYNKNYDMNGYLYITSGFKNKTGNKADENDFRNFFIDLELNQYAADNIKPYADFIFNSGKKPNLTAEDIADYMFNKSSYSNLNSNDFYNMIYDATDGEADTMLSVDQWKDKTGFDFMILNYLFSPVTLAIVLALIIVFMIWIAVIVDKRGRYLTGFYRSIFMVSGVVMLITGAVCFIVPPVVYSQTGNALFYVLSRVLVDFDIFLMVTGAFEVIVGIILGFSRKLIIKHEKKYPDFL